jgi:hypothetical protein
LAAATAWFAPLPPGTITKSPPKIVSPTAGILFDFTTKSILLLPTTTILGFCCLIFKTSRLIVFNGRQLSLDFSRACSELVESDGELVEPFLFC